MGKLGPKLVIIGLDGADYGITKDLMSKGMLPRMSAVRARGVFSPLESTVPAQTAPAWTSMTTGVNPGKHGIYYFYSFSTSPPTIINSTNTSTPRIWDLVGAAGGRSVVVNVPVTYPVRPVAGVMVSGIPPWYLDGRSVYPPSLSAKLEADGYLIDAPMGKSLERQPEELVSRVIEAEARRVGTFLSLLEGEDWLFAMVVMTGLDRMQHHLLGEGEEADRAVERGYAESDALVGRILDAVGPEARCLITSDHGFNARRVAFYPNSWLLARGLLRTKSSIRNRLFVSAHNLLDGHLLWAPKGLSRRFQGANTTVRSVDAVDLERSRAFVPGTDGILVAKSEEDAEAVMEGLSALEDSSGKKVCRVLTRDQVYKGDKLESAPELLLIPRDDINIRTDPFSKKVVSAEGDFPKGNHGPTGIFFGTGPGIGGGAGDGPCVEDVAPTALRMMGIEPPDYMDGRALFEMDRQEAVPVVLQKDGAQPSAPYEFSDADEKEIIDRLGRLGYR